MATVASNATSPALSAASHPSRPRPDPTTVAILDQYRRKYLGIDMVLKTLCYALRMRLHYTPESDKAQRDYVATLIDRIIECRMLCNSVKEPGTAKSAIVALTKALGHDQPRTSFQRAIGVLTAMSFGFRVFEQLFGDLGFTQKIVMQHWDRYYLSNKYKMFKTFSLLCCALLEINKLRGPIRKWLARWAKQRAAALQRQRNEEALGRGEMPRASSCADLKREGNSPVNGGDGMEETASVITSPVPGTPTASPTMPSTGNFALDRTITASTVLSEPASPHMGPAPGDEVAAAWDLVGLTRQPHVRSAIFLTRNIADLIVYSQWIDAWRPWKPLEYGCGMVSGGLGVLIVYLDTLADATGRSATIGGGP